MLIAESVNEIMEINRNLMINSEEGLKIEWIQELLDNYRRAVTSAQKKTWKEVEILLELLMRKP